MSEVEQFLSYLRVNRNRSESTVSAYRPLLRRLEEHLAELGKGILDATPQDLELWSGPVLHKLGLDAATRAKAISAVRGLYRWAERTGLVQRSQAQALDRPRLPEALPVSWSLEQAEAMIWAPDLSTFKGVRDAAILSFLIGTGCRVSGLSALNESDVFTEDVLGERWAFVHLKEKGKKSRQVPLPKLALVPLLMYLGHEERQAMGETRHHLRTGSDQVLFCNLRPGKTPLHEWYGEKRRLTRKGVWSLVVWYGRQAGIPAKLLHPHAARHLMGTHLYDEGIDKEDRKVFLGHERDETLAIYTRTSRKRLLAIAGKSNPLSAMKSPFAQLAEVVNGAKSVDSRAKQNRTPITGTSGSKGKGK